MPAENLPSGQISFLDLANGTCDSTSNITMFNMAIRAQVNRDDNEMSINEFQGKQILYNYRAENDDQNYDKDINYIDENCEFQSVSIGAGYEHFFTAVYGTVYGVAPYFPIL
jgi:hypothetical protein